mmetsp:Transcript_38/g.54  ORF Transcript_38/g.54 Transcript_38/m.54 type:complete len:205 (-) Transcript_38:829-1443(-)|eukprot:CAMPEP_0197519174 /NCGR_PEP_ID=MMETSP1318-20131121/4446_1 /TAXON_ID=552666 /ORGANISM="Partenskyella glossopodia, Strain RCC365" /LENGTH=204 /DNA_ID=CAMNT_0043070007 /DNA_START=12 /DNA_END=626 /DNA_ORIENTATION=-
MYMAAGAGCLLSSSRKRRILETSLTEKSTPPLRSKKSRNDIKSFVLPKPKAALADTHEWRRSTHDLKEDRTSSSKEVDSEATESRVRHRRCVGSKDGRERSTLSMLRSSQLRARHRSRARQEQLRISTGTGTAQERPSGAMRSHSNEYSEESEENEDTEDGEPSAFMVENLCSRFRGVHFTKDLSAATRSAIIRRPTAIRAIKH